MTNSTADEASAADSGNSTTAVPRDGFSGNAGDKPQWQIQLAAHTRSLVDSARVILATTTGLGIVLLVAVAALTILRLASTQVAVTLIVSVTVLLIAHDVVRAAAQVKLAQIEAAKADRGVG